MDIVRDKPKSVKRYLIGGAIVVSLIVVSVALARLRPAVPSVERGTIYFDSVVKGEMLREVRGPGTLVPEDIRWITAVTPGRIEKILHLAGTVVEAGTVLMQLTNPDVQIQTLNADRQYTDQEKYIWIDYVLSPATSDIVLMGRENFQPDVYEYARLKWRNPRFSFK